MSDLDKKIEEFKTKINNIVTDLINEGTYEDFISLQDSENVPIIPFILKKTSIQNLKKLI